MQNWVFFCISYIHNVDHEYNNISWRNNTNSKTLNFIKTVNSSRLIAKEFKCTLKDSLEGNLNEHHEKWINGILPQNFEI